MTAHICSVCSGAMVRMAALLIAAIALQPCIVWAQPSVSGCGTITATTVWDPGSVHVLNGCGVTIEAGASLTIQAGTIVKLAGSHDHIVVNGELLVAGTNESPVVLTSLRDDSYGGDTNGDGTATAQAPGDWGWVVFNPGSSGTIEHAVFGYGGVGYHGYTQWAMVKVYGTSDVVIDHTTLHASWSDGLYAENASVRVTNSRIGDHGTQFGGIYGLHYNGLDPGVALVITDNVFETKRPGESAAQVKLGNHPGQVRLLRNSAGGTGWNGVVFEGRVERDLALDVDDGVPLIVSTSISVAPEATLTVSPGAVFKPTGCGGKVIVEGTLRALGTADAPIVFTSLKDDTRGGDTNGDGGASAAAAGDWGYVRFTAGAEGAIDHAFLGYGGVACSGYDNYSMLQAYDADATLDQVTLAQSYGNGLYAESSSVSVRRSHIIGNGQFGGSAGLNYNGLDPDVTLEISDSVFATISPIQAAARLSLGNNPAEILLQRNGATGSGWNGIVLGGTVQNDLELDVVESLPLIVEASVGVAADATLTLTPGTVFKPTGCGGKINVDGTLLGLGTEENPIVFTSLKDDSRGGDANGDAAASVPQPSDWGYVHFNSGSTGTLEHVFFGYGGVGCSGYDTYTMLRATDAIVDVEYASFDAYRWNAVYSSEARLRVHRSKFLNDLPDNPMAIRNAGSRFWVDARHNWWGDASGPYHPSRNPGGSGAPVTDLVWFLPWAVDESGTEVTQVLVEGPTRVSPGDTVDYAVSYFAAGATDNAILAFVLPRVAYFTDGSSGVSYWAKRHTAFWRLGDLPPGSEGQTSVRLSYAWGVPNGMIGGGFAQLAGANTDSGILDYQSFLDYSPPAVVSEEELSAAGLAAERSGNAELDAQCEAAEAAGAVLGQTYRYRLAGGQELVEVAYLQQAERAVRFVKRAGDDVISMTYDAAGLHMQDSSKGVTLDPASLALEATGGVGPEVLGTGAAPSLFMQRVGECLSAAGVGVTLGTVEKVVTALTIPECVSCIVLRQKKDCPVCSKKLKEELRLKNLPVVGELIGFVECLAEAFGEIGAGFPCKHDHWTCDLNGIRARFYKLIGQDAALRIPCVTGSDGKKYLDFTGTAKGIKQCVGRQVCVEGPDDGSGRYGCAEPCKRPSGAGAAAEHSRATESNTGCSSFSTTVRAARDPNEKSGTEGDVTPGQEVEYTVEYENVGAGRAYGVYITDELSPHLDEATLDLNGQGEFSPTMRMIFWEIGELAPKGEEGSKGEVTFKVRLNPGLPSGTVITNHAIVYFPSVPEETPTNTVVNLVQPLAAVPQSLETDYGTALPVILSGREVSGIPLTYAIDAQPLAGELTGTAPALTYTPAENFTGHDRFTFTVGNGVSESRPAYVTILVKPSPADTTAPQVVWTYPEDGASLEDVSPNPIFADETQSLYAPSLIAVFSEAMDPSTIDAGSVGLSDGSGHNVGAVVVWDGVANQAVLTPVEPWQTGTYTVTVSTDATDASGNPLESAFMWSFTVDTATATCAGDCDGSGEVTVNELIQGVNIALGMAAVTQCPSFDANDDGAVTVNELITAVNHALNGC